MSRDNPTVSIIIPVYNAEARLGICIESVLSQSFTDFEVILVDDGSKDGSPVICDDYSKDDPRITVIHKDNGGVSSARNMGLQVATGEYITFVDSDDTVDASFLEDALSGIMASGADAFYSGLFMEKYKNDLITDKSTFTFRESKLLSVQKLLDSLNEAFPLICICGPCCKLYRKNPIDLFIIRFDESISLGEDTLFNLDYLRHCDRVFVSDRCYYHYYRGNSLSLFSKLNKDCVTIKEKVYGRLLSQMKDMGCSANSIERFENEYVNDLIGCIHSFFQHGSESSKEEKINIIKSVANRIRTVLYHRRASGTKTRLICWLLRHGFIETVFLLFSIHYRNYPPFMEKDHL